MINATELRILQSCERRSVIERDWRITHWRPRSLFNHCLERLVYDISNGRDPAKVGIEMYTVYLDRAAHPGLDLRYGLDPYKLGMDFANALRVTAELLKRTTLMPLQVPKDVEVVTGYGWHPQSFEDESGALHWWHAIEEFDKDELTAQGHSWRWGDMAACGMPLTLHLIELGYVRNGHLYGDLSRIYQHPSISKYKFQHVDGKQLAGWKAKFLQDFGEKAMTCGRWCDILAEDQVAPIHHVTLKQPEPWQVEEFRSEVVSETDRRDELLPVWRMTPKSRGACDLMGGCPHQRLCYGPEDATPENVGGYVHR